MAPTYGGSSQPASDKPQRSSRPVSIADLLAKKTRGEKVTMVTAYDYPSAILADAAGFDILLVGDSVANVVLGHDTTLPVTLEQMLYHTAAVQRGRQRAFLIGDMPFLTYQADRNDAIVAAGRFLKESGADAVKLEGGDRVLETVKAILGAGIPVMGHLGLTPQSVSMLSGYRVQGKTCEAACDLLDQAKRLEQAGIFSLVLECVPDAVASEIANSLEIPVIGIGAGSGVDGQVLVFHDILGLAPEGTRVPRFVKRYAELGRAASEALESFREEIEQGVFPSEAHGFRMPDAERQRFEAAHGAVSSTRSSLAGERAAANIPSIADPNRGS